MSRAISCSCRRLMSSRACLRRSVRASLCCFSTLLDSSMAVSMYRLQNDNKVHCLQSVSYTYCFRKINRTSVTLSSNICCVRLLKTFLVASPHCWTPPWLFLCTACRTPTRCHCLQSVNAIYCMQSANKNHCLQSVNSIYCLQNPNTTHCLLSVNTIYCLQNANKMHCLQSVNSMYCLQDANKNHCLQSVNSMYCLQNANRITRANGPSWGRASASAGPVIYAGGHWGMPCTIGLPGHKCRQNTLLAECQLYVLPAKCQQDTLLAECQLYVLPPKCVHPCRVLLKLLLRTACRHANQFPASS